MHKRLWACLALYMDTLKSIHNNHNVDGVFSLIAKPLSYCLTDSDLISTEKFFRTNS